MMRRGWSGKLIRLHFSFSTHPGGNFMGLINWIFDIYQHSKIDEARREAVEARLEAARLYQGGNLDTARLERVLGELALATKTIQRVLVEKRVCDAEEFRNKLAEVDAEDGLRDGRAPAT
jgi:hypothetical protein